jgi:hypothetical protein
MYEMRSCGLGGRMKEGFDHRCLAVVSRRVEGVEKA